MLKAAHDVEVKTENKTRRVEEKPEPQAEATPEDENAHGIGPDTDGGPNQDYQPAKDWESDLSDAEEQPAAEPAGKKRRAATE